MSAEMLRKVMNGEKLSLEQSRDLFSEIFEGHMSEIQLAALLAAMKVRGETAAEVAGAALSMRDYARRPQISGTDGFDTCGTGGDNSHSFNVSSAVALVLAAMGQKIVKHGNRSISSRSGSADFYEALGVPVNFETETELTGYFERTGFVFMFAPAFHPAMKHAMPVRRELATRTIFNMLGPLTNPARPARQMIGVFSPAVLDLYAKAAGEIGFEHLIVYSAENGMDEVSPFVPTLAREIRGHEVREFVINPVDYFEIPAQTDIPHDLDAAGNVEVFLKTVSEGKETPLARLLALNTAVALRALGHGENLHPHYAQALEVIREGGVVRVLAAMRDGAAA
jgi:anthranilate phosphoribosyltransferase